MKKLSDADYEYLSSLGNDDNLLENLSEKDYQLIKTLCNNGVTNEDKASQLFHEVRAVAGLRLAMELQVQVLDYFQDSNPYRIKLLFLMADHLGFEPTPTMNELGALLHKQELKGKLNGSLRDVYKELADNETYKRIRIMRELGYGLELACNKAAKWRKDNYPELIVKANSLLSTFKRRYPVKGLNAEIRKVWFNGLVDPEKWADIVEAMPTLDPYDPIENTLIGS